MAPSPMTTTGTDVDSLSAWPEATIGARRPRRTDHRRQHRGEIAFASDVGSGTTFTVRLPIANGS